MGALFDHGCDCIVTSLLSYQTLNFVFANNNQVILIPFVLSGVFGFFISNYCEYYTGVLNTNQGKIGVTEIQFILMGLGLSSVFLGKKFWSFPVLKLPLSAVFLISLTVLNFSILLPYAWRQYKRIEEKKLFLFKLIPFLTIFIGALAFISTKTQDQTQLIIAIISSAYQILTIKTIVYSQAKQKIPIFNFESIMVFSLAVLTQNKYFHESFVHMIMTLGYICLLSVQILVITSLLR